jgi:hypothetical protein
MAEKKTEDKPPEKTKAELAYDAWQAAKEEEDSSGEKARFMRWLDEWAENRAKSQPKPRTSAGSDRPTSFLSGLLGVSGDGPA